jgi:multiple sugar transport system permease protein
MSFGGNSVASTMVAKSVPHKPKSRFSRYGCAPYIFVSPFFFLFGLFFLVPSLAALILSLFQWNGIGEITWRGLDNYQFIVSDTVFWQAVSNTLFYTTTSVLVIMPLSLILAVLFAFVKVALIIVIGWRSFGLLTIYFLAGLQSIPAEIYEAAEIDGASTIQRFFSVTIPLLKPIILFVSIIVMVGSIQVFDEPRILTRGGPANASISVVQYLYQRGFERLRLGFASSVGTILFFVVFVVSFIQLRFFGTFHADGDN